MVWRPPKWFLMASAAGTCIGGIVAFKEVVGGGKYEGTESLEGKTVIVTGANTGIGKETALEMARRKAKVIMACRNIKKCKKAREEIIMEARNNQVFCRYCDLASQESIREFVNKFMESNENLNLLINNAGVMRCKKSFTEEGIEMQLGVNHMGHFLLTSLLLDRLKGSAPSRIINVSSIAHIRGKINFEDLNSEVKYDKAEAYSQSKLANILFTRELANRLQGTGVICNAVHPGLVNTEIGRHMGIYKSWFAYLFVKPLFWLILKTPRQGAVAVIHASLCPELQTISGKYFSNLVETEVSDVAKDDFAAKRLWAISEKWTSLTS